MTPLPYILLIFSLNRNSLAGPAKGDDIERNEENFGPINVVLFLANTDQPNGNCGSGDYGDTGIKFLNFPLCITVQSYTQSNYEYTLKNDISELVNWAQRQKRMKTAVVYSTKFRNTGISMYETKPKTKYFFKRKDSKRIRNREIFQQLPLQPKSYIDENLPVLAQWQDENPSKIPMYNLYNPGYKIKDVNHDDTLTLPPIIHLLDSKRYPHKISLISKRSIPSKESNLKSTQSEYIMRNVFDVFDRLKDMKYFSREKDLKSTEKTKRSLLSAEENEEVDNDDSWKFSSVFDKIKNIFMESFFNTGKRTDLEEDDVDFDMLGKVQDLSYSRLVKSTFKRLNLSFQNSKEKTCGYLLVVRAGNLSEISDSYSELVQTIRCILDNVGNETLFILSGSGKVGGNVPLYAKGKCHKGLEGVTSLSEVFAKVQSCLRKKSVPYVESEKYIEPEVDLVDYRKSYAEYLKDLMNGEVLLARQRYARSGELKDVACYLVSVIIFIVFFYK